MYTTTLVAREVEMWRELVLNFVDVDLVIWVFSESDLRLPPAHLSIVMDVVHL